MYQTKKTIKAAAALLLTLALVFTFCACGAGQTPQQEPAAQEQSGQNEAPEQSSSGKPTAEPEDQPAVPDVPDEPDEPEEPRVVADEGNPFNAIAGAYQDEVGQRASMDIYAYGDTAGMVSVSWANSASETVAWLFYCEMAEDGKSFFYSDGIKYVMNFDEDGNMTDETVYEDGTGSFVIYNNHIDWLDDKEDAGKGCRFVLVDAGATGGI